MSNLVALGGEVIGILALIILIVLRGEREE
jgi:hypothetical protein